MSAGAHQLFWKAENTNNTAVASGVYWIILRVNNLQIGRKLIIIR